MLLNAMFMLTIILSACLGCSSSSDSEERSATPESTETPETAMISSVDPSPEPTPTEAPCDSSDADSDGWTVCEGDCDDNNYLTSPDGYGSYWFGSSDEPEACNGVDDDCDTFIDEGVQTKCYLDSDSDGYGTETSRYLTCDDDCPEGYSLEGSDMDDSDPNYWW